MTYYDEFEVFETLFQLFADDEADDFDDDDIEEAFEEKNDLWHDVMVYMDTDIMALCLEDLGKHTYEEAKWLIDVKRPKTFADLVDCHQTEVNQVVCNCCKEVEFYTDSDGPYHIHMPAGEFNGHSFETDLCENCIWEIQRKLL